MRRKVLYAAGALLLILTNPGNKEFRSYLHQNPESVIAGRDSNFFIFSFYSNIGDYADSPHNGHCIRFYYLGVLGNFFPLSSENVF